MRISRGYRAVYELMVYVYYISGDARDEDYGRTRNDTLYLQDRFLSLCTSPSFPLALPLALHLVLLIRLPLLLFLVIS